MILVWAPPKMLEDSYLAVQAAASAMNILDLYSL